ncbi:uncharacterized protein LOC111691781 isoform X1 [Anoplophora glabripennis]|uniref:uncharacterized protein LOC111691781 isoform X1 n=2 Tax=Anoplophora glabripennis TaxID=217634 RepID=UPI000C794E1B|nr:uncharacterized protein LOC111691781 isoform X1 [Anoplophora glabripennis]
MGKSKRKRSLSRSPSPGCSSRGKTLQLEKRLKALERRFRRHSESRSSKSPTSKRSKHYDRGSLNSRGDRNSRQMPRNSTPVRSPRDSTSFGQEGFTPSLTLQDGSEGFTPSVISARSIEQENAPSPNINNSILVVHEPGLDEEVLKCLGEDPENAKTEKVELHKALSPRWQHMLTKGISKDNKLELLAKYPVPSNCGGLQTPTLNPEIAQAVSDISLKKDKYQVIMQSQLGAGITALGKAITMVLVDESDLAKSLVPILSESGKLLTDLFHSFSVQRKSFLTPQLNPLAMNIAKTSSIDIQLFGADFGERLKAAKEIEKSSKDLKGNKASTFASNPRRTEWKVPTLNSRGPSRGRRDQRQYGQSRHRKPAELPHRRYQSNKRYRE